MQAALDGPAGAGKSTIAKAAARKLGFIYIDTGAMYRAIGLKALRLNLEGEGEITAMTEKTNISIELAEDGQHIYLDSEDVTDKIRTSEVSMAASAVSKIGGVRRKLVELQREIAGERDVIMDGRDIGTVVLPNAEVKIFLTASSEARAKRRFDEMLQKGESADYESVLADMKKRDYDDSHRAESPLRCAEDAITLDTTKMTLEESIGAVTEYIRKAAENRCLAE